MQLLLSFSSVMMSILYIFLAICILLLMILIHEFGHYSAGKLLGFKVEEFAVGFGKPIYKKTKKNGEVFSLRLFPLGGFCAFAGETDDSPDPQAFNRQKPWKRLIVLFAGVFFNFLSAIIFSFILLVSFGYEIPQINSISSTSINYGIIENGDAVYKINGESIDFVKDASFGSLIRKALNEDDFEQKMTFTIKRDGKMQDIIVNTVPVEDATNEEDKIISLIVLFDLENNGITSYKSTFGEALGECWTFSFRWVAKIFIILGDLFTGGVAANQIGGPVATIATIANVTQQSFANIFVLLPLIAINLAVFNILPIPALDGAHMVFILIEWIRRKPIKREVQNTIHNVGLIVLLAFVVLVDFLYFLA